MKHGEKYYFVPGWKCSKFYGDLTCEIYSILGFRVDPVPSTGGYSRIKRIIRNPKTFQERKWSIAHKEFVRGRRNSNNLPNNWDDIWIAKAKIRSWKRTKKKKQWM